MSDYVNKVQKEGVDYDIHDERIAALSDVAGLAGNSLVIPEQEGPQPVATIDDVTYYHKIETKNLSEGVYYGMNGEEVSSSDYPYIVGFTQGGSMIFFTLASTPSRPGGQVSISVAISGNRGATAGQIAILPADDTSHNPGLSDEFFTAGYLELDEEYNGTVYFNLKSDGAPEYVDSIKQGNAVIPLKDSRVPNSAVADAGKVVKVGADGSYELGETQSVKDWLPIFDFTNSSDTLQMLIDAVDQVGMTFGDAIHCQVNYVRNYASSSGPGVLYIHKAGGGRPLEIHFTRDLGYTSESQTSFVIMRRWAQGIDPTTVTIGDFFENSTYSGNITLTA